MAFLIPALASLIPSAVDWVSNMFAEDEDYYDEDFEEDEGEY